MRNVPYSEEEIQFITANWRSVSDAEMAHHLNDRTPVAVKVKRIELGLRYRTIPEPEQIEAISRLYAKGLMKREIADQLGMTKGSVEGLLHRLGLKRDPALDRANQKRALTERWRSMTTAKPVPGALAGEDSAARDRRIVSALMEQPAMTTFEVAEQIGVSTGIAARLVETAKSRRQRKPTEAFQPRQIFTPSAPGAPTAEARIASTPPDVLEEIKARYCVRRAA